MSVSVYSGYDPTDEDSPNHFQQEHVTQQVESPDLHPQLTQTGSLDVRNDHSGANLEPVSSPADDLTNHSSIGDETTRQASTVSDVSTQNVTVEPASNDNLQPTGDKLTTLTMTTSAVGTGERQATVTTDDEPTTRGGQAGGESDSGPAVLPKMTIVHKTSDGDTKKQKKHRLHSREGSSDNASSMDTRRLRARAKPDEQVKKFGNMLDHCCSEGSDAEMSRKAKPASVKPIGTTAKNSSDVKGEQITTAKKHYASFPDHSHDIPREN